jgi:nucleoside-diphosphate-sugar epimerase
LNQSRILPSNQSPLGARPARFRRPRLLIVGCGDVGLRVARALIQPQHTHVQAAHSARTAPFAVDSAAPSRIKIMALTSSPARVQALRAHGVVPLVGNLDEPSTLARLAGIATHVVHMAPPPSDSKAPRREGQTAQWWRDPRTQHLVQALRKRSAPRSLVYGSTSGVYGDCGGAWVHESRPVQPHTPRAQRRVDAERMLRHYGRSSGVRIGILRIPGIYASDREGGTPRGRLLKGTPVLRAEDDVYTNHIHADDLARATLAALWHGKPQRIYHVSDDSQLKMGDYFDAAADLYALPRPPRVARHVANNELPLMLLSFMSESRRLDNTRMKQELRVALRYADVRAGLRAGLQMPLP